MLANIKKQMKEQQIQLDHDREQVANRSSSLYALDKLIQKHIKEAKLPHYQIVHCWALRRYLEELIQQSLLKQYVLTPKAAYGQHTHSLPSHSI